MGEEELCHHHSSISFNLIQVEVEVLQAGALLERFSQELSTFAFYFVALEIQT
jgi:hypothetical protein